MSTDKNILKDINNSLQWHCEANFTKDYHKTVKALVNKLKKNKEFSMDGGKYLGWVGGLLYVVGEDSNLFDPNNVKCDKLYYSKSEVAEGVEKHCQKVANLRQTLLMFIMIILSLI